MNSFYRSPQEPYDPELEDKYIKKMRQLEVFFRAGKRNSDISGNLMDVLPENYAYEPPQQDMNGVREYNNRPESRGVIVNWPEGGPKFVRRRGYYGTELKGVLKHDPPAGGVLIPGRKGKF